MIIVVYSLSGDTHSLIALYILSLFIDQASIMLVQSCYSSVAVISLTLAKYFYSLPNKLQSPLIQLIISAKVVGSSLS